MVNYNCDKCKKEFTHKGHYTKHLNKKNPCIVESKIEDDIIKKINELQINTENKLHDENKLPNELQINTENKLPDENKLLNHIQHNKSNFPKPILKWVGGKTQILDKLITNFPSEINNYREIFLGGGSVLLTLLYYVKQEIIKINGNIYAYDLNEPLIYIYKNIQSSPNELYNKIKLLIDDFKSCDSGLLNRHPTNITEAKQSKENYYYWIRSEYNKLSPNDKKELLGSAMFIFLNKTCFRGVFRIGPNGFNVPYGHYNNPEIINKEHLYEINELIQCVIFECCSFDVSLINVEPNDFIYLDPPYAPEQKNSFVGYNENGFDIDNHINLFNIIHSLTTSNKKIMLSNSDVQLVRENFTNEKYKITSITCKRSINPKKPGSKTKEVIIMNY